MTAFPGSFDYQLLNLDRRDMSFWAKRATRRVLNERLSTLTVARAGADLDGKYWTEEVNRVIGILNRIDSDKESKKPKALASGWGFFRMKKTG